MTSTDTANGTAPAIDWDALLNTATTETIAKKATRRAWDGPIPAGLRALVEKANRTGERVVIPMTDAKVYEQTAAMVTQVASELPRPDDKNVRSAYIRPRHNDDDALTAITFTIGNKRGAKGGAKEDKSGNETDAASESTTVTTPAPAAVVAAVKPAEKPADVKPVGKLLSTDNVVTGVAGPNAKRGTSK